MPGARFILTACPVRALSCAVFRPSFLSILRSRHIGVVKTEQHFADRQGLLGGLLSVSIAILAGVNACQVCEKQCHGRVLSPKCPLVGVQCQLETRLGARVVSLPRIKYCCVDEVIEPARMAFSQRSEGGHPGKYTLPGGNGPIGIHADGDGRQRAFAWT